MRFLLLSLVEVGEFARNLGGNGRSFGLDKNFEHVARCSFQEWNAIDGDLRDYGRHLAALADPIG